MKIDETVSLMGSKKKSDIEDIRKEPKYRRYVGQSKRFQQHRNHKRLTFSEFSRLMVIIIGFEGISLTFIKTKGALPRTIFTCARIRIQFGGRGSSIQRSKFSLKIMFPFYS